MPPKTTTLNKLKARSREAAAAAEAEAAAVAPPVHDETEGDAEAEGDAEDTGVEEAFFNQNAYDAFTKKYGIEFLAANSYVNDNLHKEDVVVPPDMRITSECMSLAEYARVISERAVQIENNAPIFVELKNEHEPIKIAIKEIQLKRCPMKIVRYISTNIKEIWRVNEMSIPFGANA